MVTAHPHLEPDPFDKEIEAMLADPEFVAELNRRRAAVERGEATVYSDEEVRARLLKLGVPLDDPAADT